MVRNKENKSYRLHNFGIFFPKKSAKFNKDEQINEVTGDISSIQEHDITDEGTGGASSREIGDL